VSDLTQRLNSLAGQLDGFRRSFQYIQDYVNIYGLKIWQEEFSRIVNYNVEQECNSFLKKKIYDWQSQYQSTAIPIPHFPSQDDQSVNFIGRLARELLLQTNFSETTYLDQMSAWYDERGVELVGIKTFTLLSSAVGVFGVTGLDKLLCFMIVRELQDFIAEIRIEEKAAAPHLAKLHAELHPTSTIPVNTDKLYAAAVAKFAKSFAIFLPRICKIGQMQLLRRQIASLLNSTCKIDSKQLFHNLEAMNESLLADIQAHYMSPDSKPYPDEEENPLLFELTKYLEYTGINDPLTKIYITTTPIDNFPLLMFFFILSQVKNIVFNKHLSILQSTIPRKKGGVDIIPMIVGFITLMKQFHSIHTHKVEALIGQYVRAFINHSVKTPKAELPEEVQNVLLFLESMAKFNKNLDRKALEGYMPAYIFDNFNHLKE